jgi:hypothetical protein
VPQSAASPCRPTVNWQATIFLTAALTLCQFDQHPTPIPVCPIVVDGKRVRAALVFWSRRLPVPLGIGAAVAAQGWWHIECGLANVQPRAERAGSGCARRWARTDRRPLRAVVSWTTAPVCEQLPSSLASKRSGRILRPRLLPRTAGRLGAWQDGLIRGASAGRYRVAR